MSGIERWDGLSALGYLFVTSPGALPQAERAKGRWPSDHCALEIPLPPLSEQRRIVTELDAEAAQMEAVRALLPPLRGQNPTGAGSGLGEWRRGVRASGGGGSGFLGGGFFGLDGRNGLDGLQIGYWAMAPHEAVHWIHQVHEVRSSTSELLFYGRLGQDGRSGPKP